MGMCFAVNRPDVRHLQDRHHHSKHTISFRGMATVMSQQASKINYDPYMQTTGSSDPSLYVTAGPRSQERRSTTTQCNAQLSNPFATLSSREVAGEPQESDVHPSRLYYPPTISPPDATEGSSRMFNNLYMSTPYEVQDNLDKSRRTTPGARVDTRSLLRSAGLNTLRVDSSYGSNGGASAPLFQAPSTILQPLEFSPSPSPQPQSPLEGNTAEPVATSTVCCISDLNGISADQAYLCFILESTPICLLTGHFVHIMGI